MRVSGPNGVVVIMLVLAWWGWAAVTPETKTGWETAVTGVTSAFDIMLGNGGGKRKASTMPKPAVSKTKRYRNLRARPCSSLTIGFFQGPWRIKN